MGHSQDSRNWNSAVVESSEPIYQRLGLNAAELCDSDMSGALGTSEIGPESLAKPAASFTTKSGQVSRMTDRRKLNRVIRHGNPHLTLPVLPQHGHDLHDFAAGTRYLPWIVGVDDLQGFRQPLLIGEYEERVIGAENRAPGGYEGMVISADHHNHDFFGKSQPDDLFSHC
jgi:hypothetical protein